MILYHNKYERMKTYYLLDLGTPRREAFCPLPPYPGTATGGAT